MIVWTLTIDDDASVKTTAHATEAEALENLRRYLGTDAAAIPADELVDYALDEAGICLYIDRHALTIDGPAQ